MATPAYLARAGEPQKPTELAGHDAVAYTPVSGSRWSFQRGATEVWALSMGASASARWNGTPSRRPVAQMARNNIDKEGANIMSP